MTQRDRFAIGLLIWSATAHLRMAMREDWAFALVWAVIFGVIWVVWWKVDEVSEEA